MNNAAPNSPTSLLQMRVEQYKRTPTEELREDILCLSLPLVTKCARRLSDGNCPAEDLIAISQIAVLGALEPYSLNHGAQFTTYARRAIARRVYNYKHREYGQLITVPEREVKEHRKNNRERLQNGQDGVEPPFPYAASFPDEEKRNSAIEKFGHTDEGSSVHADAELNLLIENLLPHIEGKNKQHQATNQEIFLLYVRDGLAGKKGRPDFKTIGESLQKPMKGDTVGDRWKRIQANLYAYAKATGLTEYDIMSHRFYAKLRQTS